jgi:hypothetical protein
VEEVVMKVEMEVMVVEAKEILEVVEVDVCNAPRLAPTSVPHTRS